MEDLQCEVCKFKWKSKTGKVPAKCPYCGRPGTVMDLNSSPGGFTDVEDLLK